MDSTYKAPSRSWSSLFAAPSEQMVANGESPTIVGTPPATTAQSQCNYAYPPEASKLTPRTSHKVIAPLSPLEQLGLHSSFIERFLSDDKDFSRLDLQRLGHRAVRHYDSLARQKFPSSSKLCASARKWAQKKDCDFDNAICRHIANYTIEAMKKEHAEKEKVPAAFSECNHPDVSSDFPHFHLDGTEVPNHKYADLAEMTSENEYNGCFSDLTRPLKFKIKDPLIPWKITGKPFEVKMAYAACRFWRLAYSGLIDPDLIHHVIDQEARTRNNKNCVVTEEKQMEANIDFCTEHKWHGNLSENIPDEFKKMVIKKDELDDDYVADDPWDEVCRNAQWSYRDEHGVSQPMKAKPSTVEIEEVGEPVILLPTPKVASQPVEESPKETIWSLTPPKQLVKEEPKVEEAPKAPVLPQRRVLLPTPVSTLRPSPDLPPQAPLEQKDQLDCNVPLPEIDTICEILYYLINHEERGLIVGMYKERGLHFCLKVHSCYAHFIHYYNQAVEAIEVSRMEETFNPTPKHQITPEVRMLDQPATILDKDGLWERFQAWRKAKDAKQAKVHRPKPNKMPPMTKVVEKQVIASSTPAAKVHRRSHQRHTYRTAPAFIELPKREQKKQVVIQNPPKKYPNGWDKECKKFSRSFHKNAVTPPPQPTLQKRRWVAINPPQKKDLTVCGDVEKNPGPDTAPIEAAASVETTANVTMVEERPTEADSTHVANARTVADALLTMAESPWNLAKTLTRYVQVKKDKWSVSQEKGKLIYHRSLPQIIFDQTMSPTVTTLKVYAFIRAGVTVRIQVNGTKFHCGRLIAVLVPPLWDEDRDGFDLRNMTVLPHVFLDASISDIGQLTAPFAHFLTHFPLRAQTIENDSSVTLGELRIYVWNVLRAADEASQALPYTIWAKFENPEMHQVTYPVLNFPESEGYVQIGDAEEEPFMKKWTNKLLGAGIRGVLGALSGGLATGAAGFITGLFFDKPSDPLPPDRIVNQTVAAPCHGASLDHSTRLALSPISQTESPSSLLGGPPLEYNLRVMLSMPCKLTDFTWKTSDTSGTCLYKFPITPVFVPEANSSTYGKYYTVYSPSMLAYVSRAFLYWRGEIKIKIQVITTQFHSGRLMVAFDPTVTKKWSPDYVTQLQHNIVTIDIEESKEIEITFPFHSIRPWLRCDSFRNESNYQEDTDLQTPIGTSTSGIAYIFVQNELVCPNNVSQDIDVNVFIYAGPSFELSVPNTLDPLAIAAPPTTTKGKSPEYPFMPVKSKSERIPVFQNREYIMATFLEGQRLYFQHRIMEANDDQVWCAWRPPQESTYDSEAWIWVNKAMEILAYRKQAETDPQYATQAQFIESLTFHDFAPNFIQGKMDDLSTRSNEPPPTVITMGARSKEIAPQTLSENSMQLETVLKRYYPLVCAAPLVGTVGFTVVYVPVTPMATCQFREPIGTGYAPSFATNHLQWFLRLFTYWRGSMRYMFTFNQAAPEVFAFHLPHECRNFQIMTGVHEDFVRKYMAFAGTLATPSVQGAITVEVPFFSPYTQCLINAHQQYSLRKDLRCQNGTLVLAFRNPPDTHVHPLTFSLFTSIGEDFIPSIFKVVPKVFEWQQHFGDCAGASDRIIVRSETRRNLGDDSQKVQDPLYTGFKWLANEFKPGQCLPKWPPFPDAKPSNSTGFKKDLTKEGIEENPGPVMSKAQINVLGQDTTAKLNETLDQIKSLIGQIDNSGAVGNFAATTQRMEALLMVGQEKLETLGSASNKPGIQKYALLAAEIVTAGAVLHCVRVCIEAPSFGSFLTLGLAFAGLIGLVTSSSLQNLVTSAADWALNLSSALKQNQAQALSDSVVDFVETYEDKLIPVTAVIGTVLYSFIFGIVPKWKHVKNKIQAFFEEDTGVKVPDVPDKANRTQALIDLRAAHFSVLGLSAIEKVFNKITELLQKFINWLLDRENPEVIAARAHRHIKDKLLFVVRELQELDSETTMMQALNDPCMHNRYYKCLQEIDNLIAYTLYNKVESSVQRMVEESKRKGESMIKRLQQETVPPTKRYYPFTVVISGEYGSGKSKFAGQVIDTIATSMDLPKYNRVFSKNPNDEYWSGYKQQPIVYWDDYLQCTEADKGAAEMITLVSDQPVTVNMAALEDKGRQFLSKAFVLTTNVPFQDINKNRDNDARRRRTNVHVEIALKEGWTANRVRDELNPAEENWDHVDFFYRDNLDPDIRELVEGGKDEFLGYLAAQVRSWHERQMQYLEQNRDAILEPCMPPAVFFHGPTENPDCRCEINVTQGKVVDWCIHFCNERTLTAREKCARHALKVWWNDASRAERAMFVQKHRRVLTAANDYWDSFKEWIEETFSSLKQKALDVYEKYPNLCKALGILAVLSAAAACVVAVMHRPGDAENSYDHSPKNARIIKALSESNSYESGPTRAMRVKVNASQGNTDPVAVDIKRKLHPQVMEMAWLNGPVKGEMKCFQLCSQIILAPWHFFRHAQEGHRFGLLHRVHPVVVNFVPHRLKRMGEKDWVLYDCGPGLEPSKHAMKYFIKEEDLGRVSKIDGILLSVDDQVMNEKYGQVKARRKFNYVDPAFGDVYIQDGWDFAYPTAPGECGSILLGLSTALPAPGKILGMHTAGIATSNHGFSVLITKEQIESVLAQFGTNSTQVSAAPRLVDGEYWGEEIHRHARILPSGDYTIHCTLPARQCPAQPIKTTFAKTPWYDQMEDPPTKKPAYLKKFVDQETGKVVSPLAIALTKYGTQIKPFPARNIQKVKEHLIHLFRVKLFRHTGKRVFPEREAILGIEGVPFAERINMKSSPGWPYQVLEKSKPGKFYMFDEEGNVHPNSLLRLRIDEREESAKQKEMVVSLWRDCLKDELRPVEKVDAGKTRLFTIAPVDFTIVLRKYFMDFVIAFYSHHLEFFSAVGINPESYEWTVLYEKLAEKSSNVIAGDFSSFDGTIPPELIMMICEVINAWYDDSTENQNVRVTLFTEIIHTLQLVENCVYQTHKGNPSGNPLTVVLNTIIGYAYFCLAFIEIYPDKSLDDFSQKACSVHYGDDNLTSVHHSLPKFHFNSVQEVLKKYGVKYTPSDKQEKETFEYEELDECTFLKRGFRRDAQFGNSFRLPTMSLDTLDSYLYWYRRAPNTESQLQENMRAALQFAAFHGRKYYDDYASIWTARMMDHGFEPVHISFLEQVDIFLSTCSICAEPTGTVAKFINSKALTESKNMKSFMYATNSRAARALSGIFEAPLYYCLASFGNRVPPSTHERVDDRWAVAIPSGEGKSWLAEHYPHIFVDHDELLLKEFEKSKFSLPWFSTKARGLDFPSEDRRILLCHHPDNTNRQMIGSFITHYPSFIRANIFSRLSQHKPLKMSREERNSFLLQQARLLEPSLFGSQ